MSINLSSALSLELRWQRPYRGVYPLVHRQLDDEGSLRIAFPDPLRSRVLRCVQITPDQKETELTSYSVQNMRRLLWSSDGQTLVGMTDQDLYRFQAGQKTSIVNDRRNNYRAVSLDGSGARFAVIYTDMSESVYTLLWLEASGQVRWVRELSQTANAVSMDDGGDEIAVGTGEGLIQIYDAGRRVVSEFTADGAINRLHHESGGTLYSADGGLFGWIDREGRRCFELQLGSEITAIAWCSKPQWAVAILPVEAAGDDDSASSTSQTRMVAVDCNGHILLDERYVELITGVAVSPQGQWLATSSKGGQITLYEVKTAGVSASATTDRAVLADAGEQADRYAAAGELDKALELLEKALGSQKGATSLCEKRRRLVEQYRAAVWEQYDAQLGDDPASALKLLREISAFAPEDARLPEAYQKCLGQLESGAITSADALINSGKATDARALLASALEVFPFSVALHRKYEALNTARSETLRSQYEALKSDGKWSDASEILREIKAIAPDVDLSKEMNEVEIQLKLQNANALYQAHRYQEAIVEYRKVLGLNPQNEVARRQLEFAERLSNESEISDRFSKLE